MDESRGPACEPWCARSLALYDRGRPAANSQGDRLFRDRPSLRDLSLPGTPMRHTLSATLAVLLVAAPAGAADFPRFEAQQIDPHVGAVCYAVTTADIDGDKKPDVVAVTEDAVVWFA